MRRTIAAVFSLGLVVSSCQEQGPPAYRGPEVFDLDLTAITADTIEAPGQRFQVTVKDSIGRTIPDVMITIQSRHIRVRVGLDDAWDPHDPNTMQVSLTADSEGKTEFWIKNGFFSGTSYVVITAAQSSAADSFPVTVLPGRANRLTISPADTAALAGGSYALTVTAFDRWNNETPATKQFTSRRTEIATITNAMVQAVAIGRGRVVATADDVSDTAWVSVVPEGTLVAQSYLGSSPSLWLLTTSGATYQTFGSGALHPRWHPDGQSVIYGAGTIQTRTLAGITSEVSLPGYEAIQPQYSRDGQWLYFSGSTAYNQFDIWRVAADGSSSPQRAGPAAAPGEHDTHPSPSPDGSKVVFASNRNQPAGSGILSLWVGDAGTGTAADIGAHGRWPVWSPVADQIAYITGTIKIVTSSGSMIRELIGKEPYESVQHGGLDWSPDGKYLVSCQAGAPIAGVRNLVIIDATTGEEMPLAFTRTHNLCQAAWKP